MEIVTLAVSSVGAAINPHPLSHQPDCPPAALTKSSSVIAEMSSDTNATQEIRGGVDIYLETRDEVGGASGADNV